MVRAPPCHGGGRGFEPLPGRFMKNFIMKNCGILAQLGEHLPYKQRVTGSSPVGPIKRELSLVAILFLREKEVYNYNDREKCNGNNIATGRRYYVVCKKY